MPIYAGYKPGYLSGAGIFACAQEDFYPAKDNPPSEQDTSPPDVHMDKGAQQDAPDTGADTSGARTGDNAGASSKSAGIDKGKAPKVPEIRAEPA
jgi:hypothetical protein